MPYNKFNYLQLTAQLNALSAIAANLVQLTTGSADDKHARTLIGTRIRTEIDRLNRHRKKMKCHTEDVYSETPIPSGVGPLTPTKQQPKGKR